MGRKLFQNLIFNYLHNHEKRRRYLAFVVALSLFVFMMVPLFLTKPAVSQTNGGNGTLTGGIWDEVLTNAYGDDGNIIDGVTYGPREMQLMTLLFGQCDNIGWLQNATTLDEALNAAKEQYLLGFASDFCAFIENDFSASEADAEGRIAVGGNFSFTNSWNYQAGSGDYATMQSLNTMSDYSYRPGFAQIICGGKLSRINPLSTGRGHSGGDEGRHSVNTPGTSSYTVYYDLEDDLFKRMLVGNIADSEHLSDEGDMIPYSSEPDHGHDFPGNCGAGCQHDYMKSINELAQMYQYDGIKSLIARTFVDIRSRSNSLSLMDGVAVSNNSGQLILRAPADSGVAGGSLIFNIGDEWKGYGNIQFQDIPENTYVIVNCGDEDVNITGAATVFNGRTISNTGDVSSNNNEYSTKILYNFYNATHVELSGNFNGTILAPNADITSPSNCTGHLSGALIAKSFTGGLEFGYRPYRGPGDMVGLTSGYYIPIDKFVTDTNPPKHLSGATFAALDISKYNSVEEASFISYDEFNALPVHMKWQSSNDTDFISFFSKVDFTGKTYYEMTNSRAAELNGKLITAADGSSILQFKQMYVIHEALGAAGFFTTSRQYGIGIYENLLSWDSMNGKTYPNHVSVDVKIAQIYDDMVNVDGEGNDTLAEWTIDIQDGTDGSNQKIRWITIYDADGNLIQKFKLLADASGKNVQGIYLVDGADNENAVFTDESGNAIVPVGEEFSVGDQRFYFNSESMMVMPLASRNCTFYNAPSPLFQKVDDLGHLVAGATLVLQRYENDEWIDKMPYDTSMANPFMINFNELIQMGRLGYGDTLRLTETVVPDGHTKAEDLYFIVPLRDKPTQMEYWISENGEHQIMDLSAEHSLRIVDDRILGAKLYISKVSKSGTPLDNAKFSLYADNGKLICSGLDGNANIFENSTFKALRNSYAQNGYLKPGTYYLTEDVTPTDSVYKNPGKIYFSVVATDNDYEVHSGIANKCAMGFEGNGSNIGHLSLYNAQMNGDSASPTISKITRFKMYLGSANTLQIYTSSYNHDGGNKINGKSPDETCISTTYNGSPVKAYEMTFSTPVDWNKCEIQNWGSALDVRYAEVETESGVTYVYSTIKEEVEADAYANQNPMLSVSEPDASYPPITTLSVTNEPMGGSTDVSVKKVWSGDEGIESVRPESITVQLYRTTSELADPKTELQDSDKMPSELYTIELNRSNIWKYTWNDLPAKDEHNNRYYYYVKELEVPKGYADSYSVDGEGTLTITNTMQTITLKAKKLWNTDNGRANDYIPASVVVRLQWQVGEENGQPIWEDVPNRSIALRKDKNWSGEFRNLPVGKVYRMVEPNCPVGWKIGTGSTPIDTSSDSSTNTFEITNVPDYGSVILLKNWWNDDPLKRPDSVRVALRRAVKKLWPENQSAEEVQQDYARLMQYGLYFYDGLMCGEGVDEASAYNWRNDCHTNDTYTDPLTGETVSVAGGFHDAGDNVMYGLPAGYTASNLGWSLYEYRPDYDTLGQTAHSKLITDYYANFFMKCAILDENGNVAKLLVQKGNPESDHKYWGIPEGQASGREENELYWVTNTGGDIAAEYAAALALSYLNFHSTSDEPERYEAYLEMAKKLYEFAKTNNTPYNSSANAESYLSDSVEDDLAWAACWLALASQAAGNTDDYTIYKREATNYLNSASSASDYCWNHVQLGAQCVNAAYLGGSWTTAKAFVSDECETKDYLCLGDKGCSRYNTGVQTIALAVANHAGNAGLDETQINKITAWCKSQMAFILGDNDYEICFITNFADNAVFKPHYGAGSGQIFEMQTANDTSIIDGYDKDRNRLLGGLISGPIGNKKAYGEYDPKKTYYLDKRSDTLLNDIASDFNANLMGAAAGLYHFFQTGEPYEIPGFSTQYLPSTGSSSAPSRNLTRSVAPPSLHSFTAAAGGLTAKSTQSVGVTNVQIQFDVSGYQGEKSELGLTVTSENGSCRWSGSTTSWTFTANADATGLQTVILKDKFNNVCSFDITLYNAEMVAFPQTTEVPKGNVVKVLFAEKGFKSKYVNLTCTSENGSIRYLGRYSSSDYPLDYYCEFTPDFIGTQEVVLKDTYTGYSTSFTLNVTLPNLSITPEKETALVNEKVKLNISSDVYGELKCTAPSCGSITKQGSDWYFSSSEVMNGTVTCKDDAGQTGTFDIEILPSKFDVSADLPAPYCVYEEIPLTNNGATEPISWNETTGTFRYDSGEGKWYFTPEEVGFASLKGTDAETRKCDITLEIVPFQFMQTQQLIQEGTTATFKVNGKADRWELDCDSSIATVQPSDDGTSAVITILQHSSDPIELTVTHKGDAITYLFYGTADDIIVLNDPIYVRAAGSGVKIETNLPDGLTFSVNESSIAKIENGYAYGLAVGTTGFTVNRASSYDTGSIVVIGDLTLSGRNLMNIGEKFTITAENVLGTVTFSSSDSSIVSINPKTGKAEAHSFGIVTITAVDSDGAKATYEINVQQVSVDPGIPTNSEFVGYYTLTAANGWKLQVDSLPFTNPDGDTYFYYIEEVDENGNAIASIQGNDAKYIPILYQHGMQLASNGAALTQLSVSNEMTDLSVLLPATGGKGRRTFYQIGGAVMLATAVGYTSYKRRLRRRNL